MGWGLGEGGKAGWLAADLLAGHCQGRGFEGLVPRRVVNLTPRCGERCAALNWQMSKQGIEADIKLETSGKSLVGFF